MTVQIESDIVAALKNRDLNALKHSVDAISSLGTEEIIRVWNIFNSYAAILPSDGWKDSLIHARRMCIKGLEAAYRRPWGENIYFRLAEMQLTVIESLLKANDRKEAEKKVGLIEKMLADFNADCPILSRGNQIKYLDLKGMVLSKRLMISLSGKSVSNEAIVNPVVGLILECKRLSFEPTRLFDTLIHSIQSVCSNGFLDSSLEFLRVLTDSLPDTELTLKFKIELLNHATEICLDKAALSRKNADLEALLLEAGGYNARSLQLRPNVIGYLEHLKIVRLQEPREFLGNVAEAIRNIKNRLPPDEDVEGKILVVRFLAEEVDLREAMARATQLFAGISMPRFGFLVLGALFDLVFASSKASDDERLAHWEALLLSNRLFLAEDNESRRMLQGKLVHYAEMLVDRKNNKLSESALKFAGMLEVEMDEPSRARMQKRIAECQLRLGSVDEARKMIAGMSEESLEKAALKTELAMQGEDQGELMECLTELLGRPDLTAEMLLGLYKTAQLCQNREVQIRLLSASKDRMRSDDAQRIQVEKAMLSVFYNEILESGLGQVREAVGELLEEISKTDVSACDSDWLYKLCWNVGVIHSKSEAFEDAFFGFRWAVEFASRRDKSDAYVSTRFNAIFFSLSCKACAEIGFDNNDMLLVGELKDILQMDLIEDANIYRDLVKVLEIQILLGCEEWEQVHEKVAKLPATTDLTQIAEVILKSGPGSVPISVHKVVLERLIETELNGSHTGSVNLTYFAMLYRGLLNAALLVDAKEAVELGKQAVSIVKLSFGSYPAEELVWLCTTAYNVALTEQR
jgi:hypothetical protein